MSETPAAGGVKGRILVVDDTPANVRLLIDMLTTQGYVVHPADSGKAAMASLDTMLPDLILLDIVMPDMDGFDVCERLKADARTRDIPVIFLSATDHLPDKVRAFNSGGVDYISKPFQIVEVLARIETHMSLRGLQRRLEERVRERTTELAQEVEQRRRAQERFLKVFHANPTPMVVARAEDGVLLDANDAAVRASGYTYDELVGQSAMALGLIDKEQIDQIQKTLSETKVLRGQEITLHTKDGQSRVFLASFEVIDLDGEACRISTFIDITERKRAEEKLRSEEERFRLVSLATHDAIYDLDLRSGRMTRNDAYQSLYSPNEPIGTDSAWWEQRVHPDDRPRVTESVASALQERRLFWSDEYRFRRADGDYAAVIDRCYILYDEAGTPVRMIGAMTDMTERKRSEERLIYLAHHDLLTDLPNRALLLDRLRQAILEAGRHERLAGVMFLDLDRFKMINDTLGHAVGDTLLKEVAGRLSRCVRESDTVARLSGDEFALVLTDIAQVDDAAHLAQKILDAFAVPFYINGQDLFVTASLGMTLFPHDGSTADVLLRNADVAMYRSKDAGRNAYHFYTVEMTNRAAENLALENELHQAIARGEMLLHYQPIADVVSGLPTGVEALVRWKHPTRGMVLPERFIPLAEETGLIVPLGEWIMREACAQCRRWRRDGYPDLRMAINLSARQFQQADFARSVQRIVAESGLDPTSLEFEITESLLLNNDVETLESLRILAGMGAALAVDDFGTGYSSLSYLRRFPVKLLKIDQSFMRDIVVDADAASITKAIISMAHALGLKTIAEGVETREQREFLRLHQCDRFQGNLFCRPVTEAELLRVLRSYDKTPLAH